MIPIRALNRGRPLGCSAPSNRLETLAVPRVMTFAPSENLDWRRICSWGEDCDPCLLEMVLTACRVPLAVIFPASPIS
ncbi:MAG: hypothetical protein SW833_06455 [Cyanobacteriota bacterium]|nr:hypothetical protein [Cyanobacteriota bacterium]